jgi:type III restriction enzyme
MLELKRYQQGSLDKLRRYLRQTAVDQDAKKAFVYQTDQPYHEVPALPDLPYVCIRIPTGGGKTLVAAHAVGIALEELLRAEHGLVLWLTPTNTIREQTLMALRDRRHPYRQALDASFGGRVTVMDLAEALSVQRGVLDSDTCIIVSTLAAFRVDDTDGRKVYEQNGSLMSHFSALAPAVTDSLERRADGGVDYSLCNVLRLRRPLVIVDEAHNARTPLSFDTLARFNPSCILEFTATPAQGDSASNVLCHVSAAELKAEDMIKLPIRLQTDEHWQDTLRAAVDQRSALERLAVAEKQATGEYLRPILLLQAQPRRQDGQSITVDELKRCLQEDFGVPLDEISVATGEQRELVGVNLFDPICRVKYIITVQALREGWDCSFAYVLCSVAEVHSATAVEQILGRIMRLPGAKRKKHEELNRAYAFVASRNFSETANVLTDALVDNGFERYEARAGVRPSPQQPNLGFWAQDVAAPSPAERGDLFEVPRLAIRVDGRLEPLEESHLLQSAWDVSYWNAEPDAAVLRSPEVGEITVSDQGHVFGRFVETLQEQLAQLRSDQNWSLTDLEVWLDRTIRHPELSLPEASEFIHRFVAGLLGRPGVTLEQLVHDRYGLRQRIAQRIDEHRATEKRTAFNQLLSPDMALRLEVTPEVAFRYRAEEYPANTYYEGNYQFQNHFYRAVGELDVKGEEFRCAQALDKLPEVRHWVRNLSHQPASSFWLQTSTDKFYPDFVAQLNDGRYLVVEFKGSHMISADDAREKAAIGALWEARSGGKCLFRMITRPDFGSLDALLAINDAPSRSLYPTRSR